jgi:hypothetical protein
MKLNKKVITDIEKGILLFFLELHVSERKLKKYQILRNKTNNDAQKRLIDEIISLLEQEKKAICFLYFNQSLSTLPIKTSNSKENSSSQNYKTEVVKIIKENSEKLIATLEAEIKKGSLLKNESYSQNTSFGSNGEPSYSPDDFILQSIKIGRVICRENSSLMVIPLHEETYDCWNGVVSFSSLSEETLDLVIKYIRNDCKEE